MAICVECGKDKLRDYQEIRTQRRTTIIICNECMKKYNRASANGSSLERR